MLCWKQRNKWADEGKRQRLHACSRTQVIRREIKGEYPGDELPETGVCEICVEMFEYYKEQRRGI